MKLLIGILAITTGLFALLMNSLSTHPSSTGWMFGGAFILYGISYFMRYSKARKKVISDKDESIKSLARRELSDLRGQSNLRALVVYLLALAVAWPLTEIVWGASGGIAFAISTALHSENRERINEINKKLPFQSSKDELRKAIEKLPDEDRQELKRSKMQILAKINWFAVTFFVSAFVFSLIGFAGGFISRSWILAGVAPILSFFTNNPVIRFQMGKDLPELEKLIVVIVAQFIICYLLAYYGAWLGLKCKQKKVFRADATSSI
jgi:hypothetical protein